jgi:2-succinyl-5-enolpyruvyl-6-hydroxy-3-cyclohexene-1-carboxylate synthase
MPVRDLDTFFPSTQHKVRFLANRGTSGIDGVVSTALGVSTVTPERTILVVGDLSFYHDMNGLLAAKRYNPDATIIIANNNGGGIFSFLPQREYTETFEKYFATPHDLTFRHAANLYGLPHSEANSWQEFHNQVSRSLEQPGTSIVEVQTDRDRNFELHKRIQTAAVKTAESALRERT